MSALDDASVDEAISQIKDVVEMAKEHGPKQPQLREMAAEFFVGVSDTERGRREMDKHGVTPLIVRWTGDKESISLNAYGCLVNLSADLLEERLATMLKLKTIDRIFETLNTEDCSGELRNNSLALLANLTTPEEGSRDLLQSADAVLVGVRLRRAVEKFLSFTPPAASEELDQWQHLASVLCNASQLQDGRDLLRRRSTNILPRLLGQLKSKNPVRRRGVAVAICNCCYETQDHDWLLNELGVLSCLLMPLAGPEELLPDERDGMEPAILEALDAQGAEKVREPDDDTRFHLLQAIHLLCTSKISRQYLRRRRAYPLIRNYDLWEPSEKNKEVVINIVNFLIRDEEEGDNEDILGKKPESSDASGGSSDLPMGQNAATHHGNADLFKRDMVELDDDHGAAVYEID